jgi:nucleoside-diphosphate-sugar epimerase
MLRNKNILITGGAGFIASNLIETLLKENNYIVIIDNFNKYYNGKEENIAEITKNYENLVNYHLIKGDLIDNAIYSKIDCEIDIIFHLAAQAGVRYSIQNPNEVLNNNIMSTVNILEYALKNNVKKVAYASSSSVYGNPIYTPCDENHPKNPISPYAISKLFGEVYANYYYREYKLPTTSLRFYTVYGPRGRPDMAIRKFFESIIHNKQINIYGDGEQIRDFTYVSDIVNGLILSAEKKESKGEVFNLGFSNPINVNSLVEKMYNIANKSKNMKFIEKQIGDVDITHSDTNKAKKMLNYHPQINIDEGLQLTYSWLLKHMRER